MVTGGGGTTNESKAKNRLQEGTTVGLVGGVWGVSPPPRGGSGRRQVFVFVFLVLLLFLAVVLVQVHVAEWARGLEERALGEGRPQRAQLLVHGAQLRVVPVVDRRGYGDPQTQNIRTSPLPSAWSTYSGCRCCVCARNVPSPEVRGGYGAGLEPRSGHRGPWPPTVHSPVVPGVGGGLLGHQDVVFLGGVLLPVRELGALAVAVLRGGGTGTRVSFGVVAPHRHATADTHTAKTSLWTHTRHDWHIALARKSTRGMPGGYSRCGEF